MFDLVVFFLGLAITAVLAGLKLAEYVAFGWLGVCIPVIVAIGIILLKHGADITDFLTD